MKKQSRVGDIEDMVLSSRLHSFSLIQRMRAQRPAAVDAYGSAAIVKDSPIETRLFELLMALALSSQTRDEVTAAAMRRLRSYNLTTPKSIIDVDEEELRRLIYPVSFYRQKTRFLKATSSKLVQDHAGQVPSSYDALTALPGIGPKMTLLALQIGFGRTEGIAVDTHVHRVSNRLGWCSTRSPEQTRAALEKWMPKELWGEVNAALVGFGQAVCLPRKPLCTECLLSDRCPSSTVKASAVSTASSPSMAELSGLSVNEELQGKKTKREIAKRQLILDKDNNAPTRTEATFHTPTTSSR